MRITKHQYYLNIAKAVSFRGTCLRRNYGAVIVKDDSIISTGYTGSERGALNCCDLGKCTRKELDIPSGERYELCRSVHAEANAIINASRCDMMGSTLYLVGIDYNTQSILTKSYPCLMCMRMIKNAGIKRIVYLNKDEIEIKNVEDI